MNIVICSCSDLSFKKGDIVILRKKIDNNWYFGECGNNHGVFPLSYVQVEDHEILNVLLFHVLYN